MNKKMTALTRYIQDPQLPEPPSHFQGNECREGGRNEHKRAKKTGGGGKNKNTKHKTFSNLKFYVQYRNAGFFYSLLLFREDVTKGSR